MRLYGTVLSITPRFNSNVSHAADAEAEDAVVVQTRRTWMEEQTNLSKGYVVNTVARQHVNRCHPSTGTQYTSIYGAKPS